MRNLLYGLILLAHFCVPSQIVNAQDTTDVATNPTINIKYLGQISTKTNRIEEKLNKKSQKAIARLRRHEESMKQKLIKIDSLAATTIFANTSSKYKELEENLNGLGAEKYHAKLDTLATTLKFLEQNLHFFSPAIEVKEKLGEALAKVDDLKNQFNKSELLKKFLLERKQFLRDELSKFGFAKELKKINKEFYYYTQRIKEYREMLKDSKQMEQKALEILSKTKYFQEFMRKNSQLASLFRLPDNNDISSIQASLAGLQTRAQVNNLIQQQIASGGPNAQNLFRQNLQTAQEHLNGLKNKLSQFGGGNSQDEIPDFKPNNQKTKSFLQRLEFGTNIQTQKANTIFPTTTDIAMSVGYRLNDKSIVGIGSSIKVGWGTGYRDIKITSQGLSIRSFLDYKIKRSVWVSGGFEMNYRSEIRQWEQLKNRSGWQQSGLIGMTKVVSLKAKFFKKTKLQLLYDFLAYKNLPRNSPIQFRIGYSFN